jgi:hypothetical protein
VKSVTVPQTASLQKEKKATVLDANGESFRKENGVIPGAVMLTSFNKYDVAKELPAGKDFSHSHEERTARARSTRGGRHTLWFATRRSETSGARNGP